MIGFQCQSVFIIRFQIRSILVGCVILVTVGFGRLQDLSNGRFSVSVCFHYESSNTVNLVGYVISVMVGFGGLRDLNNGLFC